MTRGTGSDWALPLIAGAGFRERLASDPVFTDTFFLLEHRRLRRFYLDTGAPRLVYLCGEGLSALAHDLGLAGSAGVAVLEVTLAEMLIAGGASPADLRTAEDHLDRGWNHLSRSAHATVTTRVLPQWYLLRAIVHKARGETTAYESILTDGVRDAWIRDHAGPGDRAPIVRQHVMMRQDSHQHLTLLVSARGYRDERPLEYYRTMKRVIEFLTNAGLVEAASTLEREFVAPFARVRHGVPLIARVSFAKNLAHLSALRGDRQSAAEVLRLAARSADTAGLHGQVRQLRLLTKAVEENDVRGALETFRLQP
ncbi:hypothetical protein AAH991_13375 [Microbispora sp. ZYX-F-249]|uniref:Uncharacterized protein n=1 Tax=Microbispora maris TaxID=3144104 RepID=A0ABV0AQW3_9ACTN